MAKQTEIGYEASKEWQDYQTGGTRIDAADLNHMEQGISDACNAVDELRTKRLVTYMVAQDGDTATQDLYQEPILGPCLILDLAERATYYDNGEDGEPHERVLITSGAQIDADREYISQSLRHVQGSFTFEDTAPGSVSTKTIAFSPAFDDIPLADAFFAGEYSKAFAECYVSVASITKSSMVLRMVNGTTSNVTAPVRYQAWMGM